MKKQNKYTVTVGNIGNMDYTDKKLALDCYNTYVTLSKTNQTRAANEPVTLFQNDEILEEYTPSAKTENKMIAMFNMEEVKKQIANCPKNEVVILCGH